MLNIFRQRQPQRNALSRDNNWHHVRNLQTGIRDTALPEPLPARSHNLSSFDVSNPQYQPSEDGPNFWSLALEIRQKIYIYVLGDLDIHLYLESYERSYRHRLPSSSAPTSSSSPSSSSKTSAVAAVVSSATISSSSSSQRADWSLSHCLADPRLPRPSNPLRAWPRFKASHARSVMGILRSCRRLYTESLPLLYKTNTFYFTDPHSLIIFPRLIPTHRHCLLRYLHVFWFLPGKLPPKHMEYRVRRTWREFWAALSCFNGLKVLSVRLLCDFERSSVENGGGGGVVSGGREEHGELISEERDVERHLNTNMEIIVAEEDEDEFDTQWLEIVRQVTAPRVFQLAIPNDWPDLKFDFTPSRCKIVKHDPTLAAPKE